MYFVNKIFLFLSFALASSTAAIQEETDRHNLTQLVQVERDERVDRAFERLERSLRLSDLSEEDVERVLDAADFAAEKHEGQSRKDAQKTPYILHPIGVAHYVLDVAGVSTPEILMGALLHDTVEDTNTTFAEIQEVFGPDVEGYVREVTDDKTLSRAEQMRNQIERAHEKSEGAALIKMADKLYNVSDTVLNPPPSWSTEKKDSYVQFARQVVENLPPVSPELKEAFDQIVQEHEAKTS